MSWKGAIWGHLAEGQGYKQPLSLQCKGLNFQGYKYPPAAEAEWYMQQRQVGPTDGLAPNASCVLGDA